MAFGNRAEGFYATTCSLAAAQNVALVDLTTLAINYYKTVPDLSTFFATPTEATHFSEPGATGSPT